jgi:hypothetical protein
VRCSRYADSLNQLISKSAASGLPPLKDITRLNGGNAISEKTLDWPLASILPVNPDCRETFELLISHNEINNR